MLRKWKVRRVGEYNIRGYTTDDVTNGTACEDFDFLWQVKRKACRVADGLGGAELGAGVGRGEKLKVMDCLQFILCVGDDVFRAAIPRFVAERWLFQLAFAIIIAPVRSIPRLLRATTPLPPRSARLARLYLLYFTRLGDISTPPPCGT